MVIFLGGKGHILKRWLPLFIQILYYLYETFFFLFFFQSFLRPPGCIFNHKFSFFVMEGHDVISPPTVTPPAQIVFRQYLLFLLFLHLFKIYPLCKFSINILCLFFYHLRIILFFNTSHRKLINDSIYP